MSIKFIDYLLISTLLLLGSCDKLDSPVAEEYHGGVIFTFDDNYVDTWIRADSIFQDLDWKATFCIAKFHTLSRDKKDDLLYLQSEGNEIAFHGTNHLRAAYYLRDHTHEEYLKTEIFPDLNAMKRYGFDVTSFAYPGGVRSPETDSLLWNYFDVLRGTTFLALNPAEQRCFASLKDTLNKRLVFAIGIDSHYEHMRLSYIDSLLNYAYDNSKVVLFYGHFIEKVANRKYVTTYSTITHICKFVKEKGMRFFTLRDLAN